MKGGKLLLISALCLSFTLFFSCEKEEDVSAEIAEVNKSFMAHAEKHDAEGVAGLYTEDGQLLPPGTGMIQGREGITEFWQMVMDMGIASAELESVEIKAVDDTAWETGNYTLYLEDGTIADSGKYIVIWKEVEEKWYLHRDIWNTSMPSPPPPAG
jgi:uncharacterized protein (TIGR02246 family)